MSDENEQEQTDNDPHCEKCERALPDWVGNIMVRNDEYFAPSAPHTDHLEVWCKPCSARSLDPKKEWHNLWELKWVRESYLRCLGVILDDTLEGKRPWSRDAADKIYALAAMMNPAAAGKLMKLP